MYGCTNPEYEYSEIANVNDLSCLTLIVGGYTNSTSFNFDSEATLDDGSCIPVVEGCMTTFACNYNPDANTDNLLCEFAEQYYDCSENCLTDTDGMDM